MLLHLTLLEIQIVADFNLSAWWHCTKGNFIIEFDIGSLTDELEARICGPGDRTAVKKKDLLHDAGIFYVEGVTVGVLDINDIVAETAEDNVTATVQAIARLLHGICWIVIDL